MCADDDSLAIVNQQFLSFASSCDSDHQQVRVMRNKLPLLQEKSVDDITPSTLINI